MCYGEVAKLRIHIRETCIYENMCYREFAKLRIPVPFMPYIKRPKGENLRVVTYAGSPEMVKANKLFRACFVQNKSIINHDVYLSIWKLLSADVM